MGVLLRRPTLCLVTDRRLAGEARLVDLVARAVEGGVNLVQLREKDLHAGELVVLGRKLMDVLGRSAALVVNDRLDVALAIGAHGVHLPADGLPIPQAREVAGPGMLVGRSVHSAEEAVEAQRLGADYVILGTIFPSRSKPGVRASGLGLLAETCRRVKIPVLAIGGIAVSNAASTIEAGASGVAAISAILGAEDPSGVARDMLRSMTLGLPANQLSIGKR